MNNMATKKTEKSEKPLKKTAEKTPAAVKVVKKEAVKEAPKKEAAPKAAVVKAPKKEVEKKVAEVKPASVAPKEPEKTEAAPARGGSASGGKPTEVVPPAAPKAVPAAASTASASSMIENAKRQMIAQKAVAKSQAQQHQHTEIRKPVIPTPSVVTSQPRPKPAAPVHEVKKRQQPAPTHGGFVPKPYTQPKPLSAAEAAKPKKIEIAASILVKDLGVKLNASPSEIISKLIKLKVFASINQAVNFEIASKVALEYGYEVEKHKAATENETTASERVDSLQAPKDRSKMLPRAPIVTFMGHVDHGKTSLLDAIRKTKVAAGEAGGITQHIGAYQVFLPKGAVTFLDTPGHEAFTAMRARGARATDVVVLVVAADDGVMPQTIEAIDHAKAAGVPIVVAMNKMDLPSANPDRVKKSLMEHGLMTEDWGGKTIIVGVSAKTGKGIDELLEMLALESELLELRADPTSPASGIVVEAELSKGSGVLATILVQDGTLRVGDAVIIGDHYGKVRAMINDHSVRIKEATPSTPVAVLGFSELPKAGDRFYTVKDENAARAIIEEREAKLREKGAPDTSHVTLEHLLEDIKSGKVEELKLIIKSDVQGSVEALRSTLAKIPAKNVRLNIIHIAVGDITESDVMLAAASNAVVIGFHVGMSTTAREIADKEQVDVRFYQIIYEAKTAIEKAMEGLLEPEAKEVFVGVAEVRQVFKVSKTGTIAGCAVSKGKIVRNFNCRVTRNGVKVHDGKVESLKRFKDDAREVLEGFECGIGVSNFDEILAGDRIEVFEIQKKARKLE